jgi:PhnB protein
LTAATYPVRIGVQLHPQRADYAHISRDPGQEAQTIEGTRDMADHAQIEATPAGASSITAHIVVQGAARAAEFYRDAFAAEEVERIPVPDGRLMSVQLRIAGSVLHLADEFPEMGVLAPPSIGGTPVVLALEVPDAEGVFARAVAAGATVLQPVADMFWGDRSGQLEDPFGHRWNVSQHLRDVPHDQIVEAAAAAFA